MTTKAVRMNEYNRHPEGFEPTWPEAGAMNGEPRELTREERAAIRKLVTGECANADREYGCLPLGSACYMFGKWWTGGYCRYFHEAVLPLDPSLEAALTGAGLETRPCALCGAPFLVRANQVYCSAACSDRARKQRQRGYMRKRRG